MVDRGVVKGVKLTSTKLKPCTGCILGKGHRAEIPKVSETSTTNLLELVHSDVVGPVEVSSTGGSRYFITFIDDYSKWIVAYAMRNKSDALECFKHYRKHAEVHTNRSLRMLQVHESAPETTENNDDIQLKILRSDNGGEYFSNSFKSYLKEHGIEHQHTVAYTPQQNGVAERANRTLLDLVRSLLHHKKVAKKFWAEALSTAVYVCNRVTTRALPLDKTPHHLWKGSSPDLSHLRVFGARCWYILPKKKVKKLDARGRLAVMMGYPSGCKGYKLLDVETQNFVISRDVYFDEECEEQRTSRKEKEKSVETTNPVAYLEENELIPDNRRRAEIHDSGDHIKDESIPDNRCRAATHDSENDFTDEPSQEETNASSSSHTDEIMTGLRRSNRVKKPPREWWITTSAETPTANLACLIADGVSYLSDVPNSYAEATSPENVDFWLPGIKKEEDSIRENKTFKFVERCKDMNVLPCRYIFKLKNGSPKVRIVAKGFRQVHRVDYNDTYAPVVSLTTVRCFLAIVTHFNLECDQMDVVTAFLNGTLEEEIFMEVPAGFRNSSKPNQVCKLEKALYGLKQAPRQWYAKINSFLISELGFSNCSYEPCLYLKHRSKSIILVALYVDDLLIAGDDRSVIDSIKGEFMSRFRMKDLGEAHEFLGIRIIRDRSKGVLYVTQTSYINKVLSRFAMANSKPCATPMDANFTRSISSEDKIANDVPYRQAIGSLMYLMIGTRPDIAYAVGKLAQFCDRPLIEHWVGVKRVLRYIRGTSDFGIKFVSNNDTNPTGYCDSDWAGCTKSRKSTEGYIFLLAGGAVSWRSKKQSVIATSTCEAEYIAAFAGTKEAIWLSRLISEMLGSTNISPITLYIDNQGCIKSAQGTDINQRNKHIDIRFHFVREAVTQKLVHIQYIANRKQLADHLTKPLQRIAHCNLLAMMGLKHINSDGYSIKGEC